MLKRGFLNLITCTEVSDVPCLFPDSAYAVKSGYSSYHREKSI